MSDDAPTQCAGFYDFIAAEEGGVVNIFRLTYLFEDVRVGDDLSKRVRMCDASATDMV